jgi:acetoin utilization deacetylase AcuC-like enzyme
VSAQTNKSLPESVLLLYDPLYLEHRTLPHHPERPDRLSAIVRHLRETGIWDSVNSALPDGNRFNDELTSDYILQIHPDRHIEYIKRKAEEAERENTILTPFSDGGDTNVSGKTYAAARKAVTAAIEATDTVCNGNIRRAFCALRPPGHHCERNRPMGFCVFNNAAIAARFAQQKYGIERIAIVDWDVHHGNGTQAIFYDDPSVLYISLHQYPHYPGTGSAAERGSGDAEGRTINFPLPAGTAQKQYEEIFVGKIVPALEDFNPGVLIISAGFDAHRDDPLGDMLLTEESFGLFTRILSDASASWNGKIVSLLEGGYDLNGLARSVASHILALGGRTTD